MKINSIEKIEANSAEVLWGDYITVIIMGGIERDTERDQTSKSSLSSMQDCK